MTTADDEFLLRLEKLRGEIEAWVRAERVPARDAAHVAQLVIDHADDKRHLYDRSKPFEPWLRRVTKHVIADLRRAAKTHARLAHHLLVDEVERQTPQQRFLEEETRTILRSALAALDPETRAILDAFYGEGKTTRQIADERGMSPRTVERRLAEARAAIREALARHGITEARLALLPVALLEIDPEGGDESPARRTEASQPRKGRGFGRGVALGVALGLLLLPLTTCMQAPSHRLIEVEIGLGGSLRRAALAATCGALTPAPACTAPASPAPAAPVESRPARAASAAVPAVPPPVVRDRVAASVHGEGTEGESLGSLVRTP